MTRVTRTLPKLANGTAFRSISSSAAACRSSNIINASELKNSSSKSELNDTIRSHSTSTTHRPSIDQPVVPLMQSFRTSAPKQATMETPTIDRFFLPQMPAEPPANPFTIRVPLLPDNFTPHRLEHPAETLDAVVPPPEISIVAANPEAVIALTEVVGNEAVEENIEVLSRAADFKSNQRSSKKESGKGTLSELWNDVLDDVFGKKPPAMV